MPEGWKRSIRVVFLSINSQGGGEGGGVWKKIGFSDGKILKVRGHGMYTLR